MANVIRIIEPYSSKMLHVINAEAIIRVRLLKTTGEQAAFVVELVLLYRYSQSYRFKTLEGAEKFISKVTDAITHTCSSEVYVIDLDLINREI